MISLLGNPLLLIGFSGGLALLLYLLTVIFGTLKDDNNPFPKEKQTFQRRNPILLIPLFIFIYILLTSLSKGIF